nr:hypothetical protein [Tanacetum cinerariifolium]
MLGSLDCTYCEWFGCPYAYKAQYVRGDHGPDPFILLEVVVSQDLWIWHTFFSVVGSNHDINILHQSPLFNDLKIEKVPEISFVANSTIREPADDDYKRKRYKQMRESARKDVERSFNVLKKKWDILVI